MVQLMRKFLHPALFVITSVLALHLLFLGMQYLATYLPKDPIRDKVRTAFAQDVLPVTNYVYDRHGLKVDYWTECQLLQMVVIPGTSRLDETITSPLAGSLRSKHCRVLKKIVNQPDANTGHWYKHRYTFAIKSALQLLLQRFQLSEVQNIFMAACYLSVIFFGIAAACYPGSSAHYVVMPMVICALLFSGISSFGRTISFSGGFIYSFISAGIFSLYIARSNRSYLEGFKAGVLIGAGFWLVGWMHALIASVSIATLAAYIGCRSFSAEHPPFAAIRYSLSTFSGWIIGFISSVILRQIIAGIHFGFSGVFSDFTERVALRFGWRLGFNEGHADELTPLLAINKVYASRGTISFGVEALADALIISAVLAAIVAPGLFVLFKRRLQLQRDRIFTQDILASMFLFSLVASWYILTPNHTYLHAKWTSRFLFIAIAALWLPLFGLLPRLLKLRPKAKASDKDCR